MKYKKLGMLLTLLFIVVVFSGCGTVTVYDQEVCGDLGQAGAHCAHTLTNQTRDISKANWDIERVGYLCMNSQSFTDQETAVDEFCNNNQSLCDYQTRVALQTSLHRIHVVALKAMAARKHK